MAPQVQTLLQLVQQVLPGPQVDQVLMVPQVQTVQPALQVFHLQVLQELVVVRLLTNPIILLKLQGLQQYKVYHSFQFQVLL
jgi:hypothetical protein